MVSLFRCEQHHNVLLAMRRENGIEVMSGAESQAATGCLAACGGSLLQCPMRLLFGRCHAHSRHCCKDFIVAVSSLSGRIFITFLALTHRCRTSNGLCCWCLRGSVLSIALVCSLLCARSNVVAILMTVAARHGDDCSRAHTDGHRKGRGLPGEREEGERRSSAIGRSNPTALQSDMLIQMRSTNASPNDRTKLQLLLLPALLQSFRGVDLALADRAMHTYSLLPACLPACLPVAARTTAL
jgi:hypothetical protein